MRAMSSRLGGTPALRVSTRPPLMNRIYRTRPRLRRKQTAMHVPHIAGMKLSLGVGLDVRLPEGNRRPQPCQRRFPQAAELLQIQNFRQDMHGQLATKGEWK